MSSNESKIIKTKAVYDVPIEDLELFIGSRKKEYYMKKLTHIKEQMYAKNSKGPLSVFTWNWAAFIFPSVWFAYRKMYLHFILFTIIPAILYYINPDSVSAGAGLNIYLATSGNSLYYDFISRKVAKIKEETQRVEEQNERIQATGGTSKVALIVSIIINILIIYLLP